MPADREPFLLAPGEGQVLPRIGMVKLSGSESAGAFEVIEYTGPAAPPPHIHRERDEAFFILEGTFMFTLGHEEREAPQGSLVFVPRGTRHGFRPAPDAKALLLTVPAGLVPFFAELGTALDEGRSDSEIREALAGRYDSFPAPD